MSYVIFLIILVYRKEYRTINGISLALQFSHLERVNLDKHVVIFAMQKQ